VKANSRQVVADKKTVNRAISVYFVFITITLTTYLLLQCAGCSLALVLLRSLYKKPGKAGSGMQGVKPMTRLAIVAESSAYIVPKIHPVIGHKYC
jgi:hypothetical protein